MKICVGDNVELRAIKRFDNGTLTILTIFEAVVPSSQVKRWDRKEKKELLIDCPSAVVSYNKNMGGVNLLFDLLSYYCIPVKSKKWYHRLIWHFLEVDCVQAWLFCKKDAAAGSFMSLNFFKMLIAESLLRQRKATRWRPARSSIDVSHSAKAKKGPAKPIPTGQLVLMATNIDLNFVKQKVVFEILDVKESQK